MVFCAPRAIVAPVDRGGAMDFMPLPGRLSKLILFKEEGLETAALVVQCGVAPMRVMCAPQADGTLALWHMGDSLCGGDWAALWCGGRRFCALASVSVLG